MEKLVKSLDDACGDLISKGFQERDVYRASSQTAHCINWIETRRQTTTCDKCSWHSHSKALGFGSLDAKILIVGDVPSALDEQTGMPFSHADGHLLAIVLDKLDLERKSVYTTNAIKCVLRENQSCSDHEIVQCRQHLDAEIYLVRPKIIVTMGEIAMKSLTIDQRSSVEFNHIYKGRDGIYTIHTQHPAFILQQTEKNLTKAKSVFWQDMKNVKQHVDGSGKYL